MRRSSVLLLFALACPWALADGPRAGNLELGPAWSRASTWDATAREVYLDIHDRAGDGDRLSGASSPLAWRVDLQTTVRIGEARRVMTLVSFGIPAGGTLALKPDGSHLTLVGLRQPVTPGQRIPLVLRFEKAGEVRVEATAQ
ncbi:copper chaperone PCu(A)C [Metapseudomonas otitidis]|uniref:copper chaperone PCu(A)C n=1 Tax=Metapseudomonas otitidis TaxID=319939 RepID=UPI001AAE8F0A|nr:copper chaperone PCu(A)C [Pseudomonas otitidis]MBO2926623.1 copper chaperone PCu(A)C [Pseudomonas otitidis]